MAAGDVFAVEIEASLLEKVPQEIHAELTKFYNEQRDIYEELKTNYEQLRVDSEQKFFELEKQLIFTKGSLETEVRQATEVREEVGQLTQKLADSNKELLQLQETLLEKNKAFEDVSRYCSELEGEKRELADILKKKDHEIDKLNEEWKSMSGKLTKANSERIEALAKVDEIQSDSVTIKHRETRIIQEKAQVEQQNKWLEKELNSKLGELRMIRKEQSAQILELQVQLDETKDQAKHLQTQLDTVKSQNEDLAKRVEDSITKLKESRDTQAQMEEQYNNEIMAQEKLIKLYKETAADNEAKVKEMTIAVEELQKVLKQAHQAQEALEEQRQEDAKKFQEIIAEKEEQIGRMQKELEHANELISNERNKGSSFNEDQVEAMFPEAASASRLLKSGMTLTQIYSEYMEATKRLMLEEEENRRLNQYIDQILQEIEEKAPVLKKQREDYEKCLEANEHLTRQLDKALVDFEKLRQKADENARETNYKTRENDKLKQQSVDLGRQVQMLLKELEEARGRRVSMVEDPTISSSEVSSSSQVISQKLVTFRSLQELQEQNQRLLVSLRDLSQQDEEDKKIAETDRMRELRSNLEIHIKDLETVKIERDSLIDRLDSMKRQRDMYRVLLTQAGEHQVPVPMQSPVTSTPMTRQKPSPGFPPPSPSVIEMKAMDEAKAALKEMTDEFSMYRKEKGENDKMISEQLDKFRKEASDLRVQNAKLGSQLEFQGERFKILQGNVENYKKEISALRDKNTRFSSLIVDHEKTISTLRQEQMSTQEKLATAEVQVQNIRSERDMFKTSETRLLAEKEGILKEQRSQGMLMANLQMIQTNLERSEFETKTKYGQQIEHLEKENAGLKRKLEAVDNQHRTVVGTLERQLVDTRHQRETHAKMRHKIEDECQTLRKKSTQLEQELKSKKAELAAVENRFTNVVQIQKESGPRRDPKQEQEVKDLKTKLNEMQNEIRALGDQLTQARDEAKHYKESSEEFERSLMEQTQANKDYHTNIESQMAQLKEGKDLLEKQLDNYKQTSKDSVNQHVQELEQLQIQVKTMIDEIAQLERRARAAEAACDQATINETTARQDLQKQVQVAQEAQDKYQRQLVLHAEDAEKLIKVSEEAKTVEERIRKAENEAREAREALLAHKEGFSVKEQLYQTQQNNLEKRLQELQQQNKMVHEELESMSDQMVSLQQVQERDKRESATLVKSVQDDDTGRSSEQLLEVTRFLRKEKDIAEARLEVVEAEIMRHKQRAEHLEHQLQEVTQTLNAERQKGQVSVETAAKHSDLMLKVENMNVLTDSNRLMREEKQQLQGQLEQAEAKILTLEQQIVPLQQHEHELQARLDSLETEKQSLNEDVERWKQRTKHLVEVTNKADPELLKRVTTERNELQKQLSSLTEENQRNKAELSKIKQMLMTSQTAVKTKEQDVENVNKQIVDFKAQLEVKNKSIEENSKTIIQLRKIGRKYRMTADQNQKELDQLKASMAQGAQADNIRKLEEQVKTWEEKCQTVEKNLAVITEKLGSTEYEKSEATKALKEKEMAVNALNSRIQSLNEELKKSREECADSEKKQAATRNILQTAKTKLTSQKLEIEKAHSENAELKKKLSSQEQTSEETDMRLNALKSQYEEKINKLESELGVSQQSPSQEEQLQLLERLQKENAELQQKIGQLQKQLDSQVKQQQQQATRPTMSTQPVERASAGPSETPRTANIRPMATPTSQARIVQSAPVQPVRSTSGSAETRAMASIRPMAVSPMAQAQTVQTPTATVMPTTVTVHDGDSAAGLVTAVTQGSSRERPTQQVQPVSPHREDTTEEGVEIVTLDSSEPVAVSEATPSTSTGTEASGSAASQKRPRADSQEIESEDVPSVKRTRTQEGEIEEVVESNIVEEPVGDEQEVAELAGPAEPEEVQTDAQEFVIAAEGDPSNTAVPADSLETTQPEPEVIPDVAEEIQTLQSQNEEEIPAEAEQEDGQELHQADAAGHEEQEEEEDEVVIVEEGNSQDQDEEYTEEDAEEEQEEYEVGMEDYEEEEEEEEVEEDIRDEFEGEEEDDEEGEMDEEYEEVDEDETEEAMQQSEEAGPDDDDDDVVIVDDDDEEAEDAAMESQEEGQGEAPATQSPAETLTVPSPVQLRQPPPLGQQPPRTERLPSVGRSTLAPFMLGVTPAGFEEGDDGIVPSTPTLFVPRRNDGFAEAVSSPHISQGRFVFTGAEGMTQPELAQLASQGALGMDDTSMDLSAFDESTGRSLPTTPRSRTPPIISITEAPPQECDPPASDTTSSTQEGESSGMPRVLGEGQDQPSDQEPVDSSVHVSESSGDNAVETSTSSQPEGQTKQETAAVEPGEGQGEGAKGDAKVVPSGGQETEPTPSTSSGTAQEKSDTTSAAKPKIQKIVWDEPAGGVVSGPPIPQVQRRPQTARRFPRSPAVQQRGRGAVPSYPRNQGMAAQPPPQPLIRGAMQQRTVGQRGMARGVGQRGVNIRGHHRGYPR